MLPKARPAGNYTVSIRHDWRIVKYTRLRHSLDIEMKRMDILFLPRHRTRHREHTTTTSWSSYHRGPIFISAAAAKYAPVLPAAAGFAFWGAQEIVDMICRSGGSLMSHQNQQGQMRLNLRDIFPLSSRSSTIVITRPGGKYSISSTLGT